VSTRKKVKEEGGLKAAADVQLGMLAGGIAHDLNTIITTIYGYSEMAL